MSQPTDSRYSGRSLVVILSMHRSGSSLTTNLLHELGMSLGPFELIGPLESNRRGHFEPVPVNHFDMRLQQQVFGFDGDLPRSEETLAQFLQSSGNWDLAAATPEPDLDFGRKFVRRLAESGDVSGFKDPRVVLLWPYWSRVLSEFSELRVVLLTVLRSPHEVAMSIFMRGKGQFTYHDALDMTAVCLRRIQAIRESWPGEQALVRFDPRVYENDMRKAVRLCNLTWRDEAYRTVYVSGDRHYDPTRVEHPAQLAFDALSGLTDPPGDRNVLDLAKDAALRERLIQSQVIRCASGLAQAKSQAKSDVAGLQDEIAALNWNLAATSSALEALAERLGKLEREPLARALRRVEGACAHFRGAGNGLKKAS